MKTRAVNPADIEEWKFESVLASLLELADSQGRLLCPPFRVLESKEEFPLYYEHIKNPIDLRTIGEKIRQGEYSSWLSFDADIKLLIRNAKSFNEPGSTIFKDAGRILVHYNKTYDDVIHPSYKLSQSQIEHNHDVVTSLLESGSSEPDNLSEDSEEDEDSETAQDPRWMLYWRIRNFDVINGFPLCTHFLELPSKKCYPDYYEEIEKPVSLYMINKMLKRGEIKSLADLIAYLQQMFKNARSYNVEESEIYEAANTLEKLTIETTKELDPTLDVQLSECPSEDQEEEKPKARRKERSTSVRKIRRPARRSKKRGRKMSENSSDPSLDDDNSLQVKSEEIAEFSQSRSESIDFNEEDSVAPPRKRRLGRPRRGEKIKPGRKSLEELREKFSETLLSVWKIAKDLKMGSRALSDAFLLLPKVEDYPDYYTTIKRPIDLTTIRKKIESCEYQDSEETLADFVLMCENTRKYNQSNSQIALDATLIESAVRSTMKSVTNDRTIYYPYRKNDKNWTENATCSSRALGKPRRPKAPKIEAPATVVDTQPAGPPPAGPQLPMFMMTPQGMIPCYPPGAASGGGMPFFVPPTHMSAAYPPTDAITLPPGMPPPTFVYVEAPVAAASTIRRRRPLGSEDDQMISLLDSIISRTDSNGRVLSEIFMKLPTKAEYPDYYEVIRRPMDLNRISAKLNSGKYDSLKTFIADMNLVFDNACTFNEPDSQIYADALTLQREVSDLRNQLDYEETVIPSVQAEMRRLINDLFQAVITYKDSKGRRLSNWLADIHELLRKVNAKPEEFPFTLDEMKSNLAKNRYLRLDRFQEDLFALFSKAREYTKSNTEIFNVTVELQQFFINKRDELCKNCLKSPAMLYNESLMNGEIEDLEKRKRQRIRQKSLTADAEDVDSKSGADSAQSSSTTTEAEGVKADEKGDAPKSPKDIEESFDILDVNRYDVPENKKSVFGSSGDAASDAGVSYYQQLEHENKFYQLGNSVLVFREGKPHCDVMRIDRMWKTADFSGDKFFSGVVFVRPTELIYEPSNTFHKREVIAVEQQDITESFKNIQAKCAVLAAKQFETCRPTEIPECDVFVMNFKVPGNVDELSSLTAKNCSLITSIYTDDRTMSEDGELNFRYSRPCRRLKTYKLSADVIEDEVFYFKTPIIMEKSFSPQMMTTDSTLSIDHSDLDNESHHLDEIMDGPQSKESQDASWLASQPKLNSKSKSGYILFSAEVRKRIMNENPEAGFGEVSKIVGVEWKKLSSDSKRQYEARAQFIAEERAKAEPITPSCKPGQICVYTCRWERCDFSFNSQEGLHEHIRTSHAINVAQEFTAQRPGHKLDPLSESKSDTQYVCMWSGCSKFRRDGKPFPTLPKMLRHVKEKHLSTAVRAMDPEQRPKNYFVYYTPEQLQYHVGGTSSAIKANEPGRFVHYPYGIQPQTAIACTVATPTLSVSRTNSPTRAVHSAAGSNLPQTPSYVSNGVNGAVYHATQSSAVAPAYAHSYSTPASSHQSYAYASQPSVSSVAGVVAHPQYQQQMPTINGTAVGEGTNPYSVQQLASTATAHILQQQQSHVQQHMTVDANRIMQSPGGYVTNTTPARPGEPVYIAQPGGNSVHVKRVVHPEYVMNYYVYYTPEQMQQYAGANGVPPNGVKPNEAGRFVHYPYGVQSAAATPTAAAGSRSGSPSRQHQQQPPTNSASIPHATAYIANGVNGNAYHPVASTHASATSAYVQSYGTSTSSQHYLAYSSQPSVSSTIPQQQASYHHANGAPVSEGAIFSQQIGHQSSAIDAGRAVLQSPNHVASTSGPVFAAPPSNSVQVRRVLHSEAYVKYIESLYSSKQQRSVSKWDNGLLANHRNTSTNHRKLPYDWVRKISPVVVGSQTQQPNGDTAVGPRVNGAPMSARAAKAAAREARAREKEAAVSAANGNGGATSIGGTTSKEEQEVVRSLWRLRDQLLESTTGIQRAAATSSTDN